MCSAVRQAFLTVVVVVLGLGALVGLEACQFFGKTTEPSEQASKPARRKASEPPEKKATSSEKQPEASDQREASPERKAKPSKKTGESPEKPADRPEQAEEPSKRTTSPTSQSGRPSPEPSPELTDAFMADSRITVAVQMKLTGDRDSNFARVDVETDHGVVTLRGVVYSDEDKRRAAELARRIDGVARVDNNLQIE